ncbi:hypothetical protein B2J88_49705 [Rhodococcus sp. SRB_17]|nr:hypothetical protein [Rhodococcus sp. SRB_17]
MSLNGATLAVLRSGYQLLRYPLHRIDNDIVSAFFDEHAPTKLAYEHFLIGCDRIAATALDDESAAAHAERMHQRSAGIRYGIARRRHQIQCESDAVLAGHRARFLLTQRRHRRHGDEP